MPHSVQVLSLSCVWLFVTPWIAARQASLSITNTRAYSNSYPLSWWCHPTISSSVVPFCHLQSFPTSGSFQRSQFFALGGQSIDFSFSISPSNEYSGLISFQMDWFDLLAIQVTLKSLLQHHFSKASILQCSTFFIVQLVAQLRKNPFAVWETWVWSLGWEDPLEKRKAAHSSVLAWRIPWTIQLQRVRYNWVTFTFILSIVSLE